MRLPRAHRAFGLLLIGAVGAISVDEIVSEQRSRALAEAFRPGQVQVVVVPGVGHNTLDLSPKHLWSVERFCF